MLKVPGEVISDERGFGIYVHIPYCLSKCPYCDFNSKVAGDVPEERYVASLLEELKTALKTSVYAALPPAASLYFGGGTPSVFSPSAICSILEAVVRCGILASPAEITVEVNPATVDIHYLKALKGCGINRLSIGAQSFSDKTLKSLGRIHNERTAKRAFKDARSAGFTNIGLDLIFAAPEQTIDEWSSTVKTALSLRPEHISIYGLTYEEGTPFNALLSAGDISRASEDTELSMFKEGIGLLASGGYLHYEISNLSLEGFWSRHNMNYWLGGGYLGLGAGAHSFIPSGAGEGCFGVRRSNEADPEIYMKRVKEGGEAVSFTEELTRDEAMTEAMMLGLRSAMGVDIRKFTERFGTRPEEALSRDGLFKEGLIYINKGRLLLTEKGLYLYNEIY